MSFDFNNAVKVANHALFEREQRNLTDVEIIVLEGSWGRLEYDQIAARHQYATSYLSQDVAPKLWKLLSEALGEKVKKSNFKEALKRRWEEELSRHPTDMAEVVPAAPERATIISPPPTAEALEISGQGDRSSSADFYIERPAIAAVCYDTLLQPGALIRIKAPRLMGKTTLINRVLNQISAVGFRTVNLSLELADRRTHLTHLDRFLRWLCLNLSRELGLPNRLEDYWDEAGMGSKVSCTTYVEEYLLGQDDSPLVLCLDDVDLLFPYPEVYEDFFGLLRSWYEKARSRQSWKKLRLMISHATDVYIRLNINQSPFNVGLPIYLPEFTLEQAQQFAQHYGLNWTTGAQTGASELSMNELSLLMQMVGGHPYLLEQAFSHLKGHTEVDLTQLLQDAPTDAGIYSNHLREHWMTLQQHPELANALKQIINSAQPLPLEPLQIHQLQSMGLVIVSGAGAAPRCHLYRQYFQTRLGAG